MELLDFYPSPNDLIESEITVLNYLRSDRYIKESHSQFAQHAGIYYGRYRQRHSRGFEFFSYFDVCHAPMAGSHGHGKPNLRLTIAALIELTKNASYSNVTYCLSVCRFRPNRFPILRKFHFDVTVTSDASQRRSQQHPQCHLQYCGEMIPHLARMGCRDTQLEQMHPSLSEPRIFFWPMSLALLVDMALHEFPDRRSANFRASSEWRSLVRSQEALVLRPFYKKCVEVIGKHRTLADEFYIG
jgi:hypothetical protein